MSDPELNDKETGTPAVDASDDVVIVRKDKTLRRVILGFFGAVIGIFALLFVIGFGMGLSGKRPSHIDSSVVTQQWERFKDSLGGNEPVPSPDAPGASTSPTEAPTTPSPSVSASTSTPPSSTPTSTASGPPNAAEREKAITAGREARKLYDSAEEDPEGFWRGFHG